MDPRLQRSIRRTMIPAVLAAVVLPAASAAPVAAAHVPTGLSPAAIKQALASMDSDERAARTEFSNPRYVVVSYSRSVQVVDAVSGAPLGAPTTGSLSAKGQSGSMIATSTPADQLTLTVAVAFDREAPAYRWDITTYWKWKTPPTNSPGEDSIAVAWANNLALNSAYGYGYYGNGGGSIPEYQSDVTPNIGVAWSFNERKSCVRFSCYANYGYLLATIKETTAHGDDTNIVAKYFHTYQDISYTIGFQAVPGIYITPTSNQWSLAVSTDFID